MSVQIFQYYDGLAWVGPVSFDEISAKIQEKVITPDTWIVYGSDPKIKAGDFPGLFVEDNESEPGTGSFRTVNMTQDWIKSQTGSDEKSPIHINKTSTADYDDFYGLPENLNTIFGIYIVVNSLLLGLVGVSAFVFPGLLLMFFLGMIQFLITIWIYNILIVAFKSYTNLMRSFQQHLRKQTDMLSKISKKYEPVSLDLDN